MTTTIGGPNDAATIALLLRKSPAAKSLLTTIRLSAASVLGCRPRDLDIGLLEQALAQAEGTDYEPSLHRIAFYVALDNDQPAVAAAHLDRVLAYLQARPAVQPRPAAFHDAAYLEARYGRQAETARAWFDLAQHLPQPSLLVEPEYDRWRSEAAVLLAEGQAAESQTAARRAQALLPRLIDAGGAKMEEEILAHLLAESGLATEPGGLVIDYRPVAEAGTLLLKTLGRLVLFIFAISALGVVLGVVLALLRITGR